MKCVNGHEFHSSIQSVKNKIHACPKCEDSLKENNSVEHKKSKYYQFGTSVGGEVRNKVWLDNFLSNGNCKTDAVEFKGVDQYYNISCIHGHQFEAKISNLLIKEKKGQPLCFACTGKNTGIDTCKDWGMTKGFEILSVQYQNMDGKLDWKCSKGHQFVKSFRDMKRTKFPCPEC